MTSWSTSLPQIPKVEGYSETLGNVVVRTQMDAGPAKVRRRFTAGVETFKCSMILLASQATTFDAFFNTTIQGGALSFDWNHPRTQSTGVFRIVGQPTLTAVDGGAYQLDFDMEQLP